MPDSALRTLAASIALVLTLAAGARAQVPAPVAPPPMRRIEFALLEDYDKGADLGRVRADFRVMKELGIRTWRGSFGWDDYEPRPGVYDLAWLRRFVALAEREGITLRPYLGYTPAWAAAGGRDSAAWNDPPRSVARWQAFVGHIAAAFSGSPTVASWEIYNEEDAPQWWDGSEAQYAAVLDAGAAAVRAAAPRAQVLLGGMTWPKAAWLEALCRRPGTAGAFDIAALHVYAETWPRDLRVEDALTGHDYHAFLDALHRDCRGQPLYVNETGFATSTGRSEADQAAWWARAIATYAADTAVKLVGIYETRDLKAGAPVIGEPENFHLGLRYADGRRKEAYYTVKLMVSLLSGPFRILPLAAAEADTYAHLFQRANGRRVLVAWTRGAAAVTRRFDLGRPARRLVQYALTGRIERTLGPAGPVIELRLAPGEVAILTLD